MLNLHQGFYKNIGPLKDKSLLVNYKDKNVLVKAPIGTGKSFLFFDGPIFGLYKYADRTIINKDSKTGEIQLLFSLDNRYFLIIRKLSQTKSGKDSTKSMFYEILADKNFIDYLDGFDSIMGNNQNDILTLLKFNQIKLEDLTTEFKQESSLQQALNDLLPPKEVALTTIFLPQNSENIFEMIPSARISVLKKVFGILGIDEAKKLIDEAKTKVYGELKARENTSSYQERIFEILEKIKATNVPLEELQEFLSDFDLISPDKLDLDKAKTFEIDFEKHFNQIKQVQNKYKDLEKNIQFLKQQIQETNGQVQQIKQKISQLDQQIQKSEKISNEFSQSEKEIALLEEKITQIQEKYGNLQQEYEKTLNQKSQLESLQSEIQKLKTEKEKLLQQKQLLENKLSTNISSQIQQLSEKLEDLTKQLEQAQNFNFSQFAFEKQVPENIQQLNQLIIQVENEGKNYKLQIEKLTQQFQTLENNLKDLASQKFEEQTYFCKKISGNCPFIGEIQKKFDKSLALLEQQKQQILTQKKQLEEELTQLKQKRDYLANWWKTNKISEVKQKIALIESLQGQIGKIHQQLKQYQSQQNEIMQAKGQLEQVQSQIKQVENKISLNETKLQELKQQLQTKIFQDYKLLQELQKQKEQLTSHITSLSNQLKQTLQFQTQKEQLQQDLVKLEKKLQELKNKLEAQNKEFSTLQLEYDQSLVKEKKLINLKELLGIYNDILEEYNQNKLKVQKIKKKYKILRELSNIFGKELVIYVFSDYLKSLEELINYFISDIVNFNLHIELDEKGENLDIFVEDNLGIRPVSSLSGGQKTALRIGWILAISKLQNNKMLFLDETINNFDQDSVGLLAEKIKEFVKAQNMKFYMITHSEILQQADIWDEVVELILNDNY